MVLSGFNHNRFRRLRCVLWFAVLLSPLSASAFWGSDGDDKATTSAPVVDAQPGAAAPQSLAERVAQLERIVKHRADYGVMAKIDALEQENRSLRGLLEVQKHEMDILSRRQRELYADVDRRLGRLLHSSAGAVSRAQPATPQSRSQAADKAQVSAQALPSSVARSKERQAYRAAYQLLEGKRYREAVDALRRFITLYPKGHYVANAHYWLGEVYLLRGEVDAAEKEFKTVTDVFSRHQKAADALLKLGYVYVKQGRARDAKQVFMQVKKRYPGTSVARLAGARLQRLQDV